MAYPGAPQIHSDCMSFEGHAALEGASTQKLSLAVSQMPPSFAPPKPPKVTVAMCARNEEDFIAEAVTSVLTQSETEWELVIVDDASDDATPGILREFSDPRIRIIRNESQRGIPASRNVATRAAQAPVIVVMDADDVSAPERIREQLDFLQLNPDVGAVGSFVDVVDAEGLRVGTLKSPLSGRMARDCRLKGTPLIHPSIAIRKEVLVRVNGYRERFRVGADYDLLCRICEVCEVAAIPKSLCCYRLSPKSISVRSRAQQAFFIGLAKRFAAEREVSRCDSYETADWRGPASGSEESSEAEYHLLVGKLAARLGNPGVAHHHFQACSRLSPWDFKPRLFALLSHFGSVPYGVLRKLFGSA